MDKEILGLLTQLIADLQKIVSQAEGDNAQKDDEPALEQKDAVNADTQKKEEQEDKEKEEQDKKEEEERAQKLKKQRTALLQRLDLIAL